MEHVRRARSISPGAATIEGESDGTIRFAMDGGARSTFLRNRIGFCVLHPIRECAGARCPPSTHGRRHEAGDGEFPRLIAPATRSSSCIGLSHEVTPGTYGPSCEFEGDLFETEDQRNWIDASFKTFCTPLRLPFPVEIEAGDAVRTGRHADARRGRAVGPRPRIRRADRASEFVADTAVPLPEIGLGAGRSDGRPPDASQIDLLRAVEARSPPRRISILARARLAGASSVVRSPLAEALDVWLDVAFSAGDEGRAEGEMRRLAAVASARRASDRPLAGLLARRNGPPRPRWWKSQADPRAARPAHPAGRRDDRELPPS